jgi:hypothetical protein
MPKPRERSPKKQSGQSFIELAVILSVLIVMLGGVVEFGYLLNQYITLVEGTRETARYLSPFLFVNEDGTLNDNIYINGVGHLVGGSIEIDDSLIVIPPEKSSLWPLTLDPSIDDIVISIVSIENSGNFTRYPRETGYSHLGNFASRITNEQITARLVTGAPSTGAVIVEVFYHYHQILNILEGWTGPIEVHAYTIMPLSGAQPTATPLR